MVGNTTFIETTAYGDGVDGYWGYRAIDVKDWEVVSYNYKEPRHSIPLFKLDVEYDTDGRYVYKAEYSNKLEMDVAVTFKFYVPLGRYEILSDANIISTQEREGAEGQEILVRVFVEKGSKGSVIVIS